MARRGVYSGAYTKANKSYNSKAIPDRRSKSATMNEEHLSTLATDYLWTVYSLMTGNYLTIISLLIVLVLSYLIPDITSKIQATKELNSMKKVLDLVATEVGRAEAACLTVANDVCYLRCSMKDNTTETSKNTRDLSVCTSCVRTTQSEPVKVNEKVGFLRKIFCPYHNASHKEIAIMSYVYTHSFDAKKENSRGNLPSDQE
ncbi:uncharacterized protein isoform X1 [Choristoneura fumiferana]|uniref:uncharacterized protein isoform X1 n=1 Tax=Choristoneura fumiferana TaxID=7141 RepID=UPI003D15B12F